MLPVQAATGGRSGVSVYKAGRSVPLDSAQLDLSRLALPQLGSAGVEKCLQIHVPSSGLKTQKNRKRPKMHFTNRIRALAANLLQNAVRQETTRLHVPSSRFSKRSKTRTSIFLVPNGIFHNWVRQETTEIHVPSSRFENAKKPTNIKKCNSRIESERSDPKWGTRK